MLPKKLIVRPHGEPSRRTPENARADFVLLRKLVRMGRNMGHTRGEQGESI